MAARRKVTRESASESAPDESFAQNKSRLTQMGKVAARFGKFRPAIEVIRHVEAVPTQFVQYDMVGGVGGHPISRVTLVHGPSSEGKSQFALGVGASFLRRDHFFGFVDAERTTPLPWVAQIMRGLEKHPGFVALAANTYEEVILEVRRFCETIGEARAKGEVSSDTTGLLVIDSIRKLVPAKMLEDMLKELKPSKGDKKAKLGSRSEQIKAKLNAAWMDELVPLLADTRTAMMIIAREYVNADAGMYERDWVVGGGNSLYYESSIDVRVTRKWVYDGADDEKRVVGERHRLDIHKTKVSGKSVKVPCAYYHTSNGILVPAGFDAQRDVLELAEDAGIVQKTGSWYCWNKTRIGNGISAAVKRLHSDGALFAQIESDVRLFVAQSSENSKPPVSSNP